MAALPYHQFYQYQYRRCYRGSIPVGFWQWANLYGLHPAPVFNTRGTYAVKLTVNSSTGCTATKIATDYLNVANYSTDIQLPSLVCKDGTADFKAVCTPQANALDWEIDGIAHPLHNKEIQAPFTTTGTHSIKLKATYGLCQQETTRLFTVNDLPNAPEFEVIYNTVCGGGR
ncbi:hypothetical protein [Paraflavitalea speifideaquila]|uniref:hypothetical protein n=1 Tax=Paraflavitalea speifideaquila TaxID=3076558 RepID=UPI0028E3692C|nr:hypothetical protein [Paraflavitalea speifideiaquila]